MTLFDREYLFWQLEESGAATWVAELRSRCQQAFRPDFHGSLPDWIAAWQQLPSPSGASIRADSAVVRAVSGDCDGASDSRDAKGLTASLTQTLRRFHPWRKGPFEILGVSIDTEWRSDLKWDRLIPHVELQDKLVLDVGCGNGYYGWRMLAAGARLVCGLDPMLLFVMQYEVLRKYAGPDSEIRNFVLPTGDDVLTRPLRLFDTVFSMGVLYHRSSPIDHLQSLWMALRPGGQLILETLIIDDSDATVLVPSDRYAKMRNVWFIPSISMLLRWLQRTGFRDCRVLDVTVTTSDEQRRTDWMTFESLNDFLDPADVTRTIEGYPAPRRAIVTARTA